MDFFDKLLKYIGVSAFLNWLRRRRRILDIEEDEQISQKTWNKEKVIPPAGKLLFRPRGFNVQFDLNAHRAMPKIQKRAVFAWFDRFGLTWVPAEYFSILARYPDPVKAFRMFCREFELDAEKLGRWDPVEIRGLHQCVGILVELDTLKEDLLEQHRLQILSLMRDGAYHSAEHYLDAARLTSSILKEAEDIGQRIVFPHYQGFIQHLQQYAVNPFSLKEDDVDEAREVNQAFILFQDRFDHVVEVLNGEIAWMYEYWPENDWANENIDTRDGLVIEKERIEKSLREDSDVDIEEEIAALEEILVDLKTFIEEIQANYGGGYWQEPDKDYLNTRLQRWFWALDFFGFQRDEEPSKDELKKAYRKKAMEYHPDRHVDKPPDKQKEFEELFKFAGEARQIIENGKPETN